MAHTSNSNAQLENSANKINNASLSNLKNLLLEIKYITNNLSIAENNLRENINNVNDKDWDEEIMKIEILKTKLQENLEILDNPVFVKNVAKCVSKRKSKRLAIKAKKHENEHYKRNVIIKRNKMHEQIDNTLRNIANEHKKDLQKKIQIKESESILSDVKSRINEARHWLGIIEPLKSLRSLRNQAAVARGEKLSSFDQNVFDNTIDKLKEIWQQKLELYLNEEQELKKTLNLHYEKRFPKIYEDEWKTALFGENGEDFKVNSIQELIRIRSCWDQFIVSMNAKKGSKIPIGFVLPAAPSSDLWKKYLSDE